MAVKIRNLKRKVGDAVVSAWPQGWTGSYTGADKFAVGDVGVLKSVKRLDDRLSLIIEYEGREHVGSLQWDAPPSLDEVERVLKAHLGEPTKAVGDLDL